MLDAACLFVLNKYEETAVSKISLSGRSYNTLIILLLSTTAKHAFIGSILRHSAELSLFETLPLDIGARILTLPPLSNTLWIESKYARSSRRMALSDGKITRSSSLQSEMTFRLTLNPSEMSGSSGRPRPVLGPSLSGSFLSWLESSSSIRVQTLACAAQPPPLNHCKARSPLEIRSSEEDLRTETHSLLLQSSLSNPPSVGARRNS